MNSKEQNIIHALQEKGIEATEEARAGVAKQLEGKTIKYSTAVSRYLKASGQSKNQAGTKAADKQLSSLNKLTTATAQKLTNAAVKQVSAKFQEMLTDGTFLNAVMEDLDPLLTTFNEEIEAAVLRLEEAEEIIPLLPESSTFRQEEEENQPVAQLVAVS